MTAPEVKRRLAAILSADVKGYSRLMGADEEGTLQTLTAYREVMATLIQQHNGRVVNAPGDALLAEFESVVDAVKSAAEIQRELAKRNTELPPDRRMEYRIGINLGDVMVDGESIYGDGVNIAARLESLADGGGICISGTAFDQVKAKLPLGYEYRGEQTVKNIADPVRVYKVLMELEAAGKVIGEKKPKPRQWQRATIGLVVALIVVVAAIVIWKLYTPPAPQPEVTQKGKIVPTQPEKPPAITPLSPEVVSKEAAPPSTEKVTKPSPPPTPKVEVASKDKMAFPLPDVPSIAVLPFVNMSGDPKQEFFSDGITEEIITALSKVLHLFVISRQSTFSYKGKPVKVKQVSEELGVRYVLEGSLQRSGDRIRINAQLIDALTGRHIWAQRYDRDLTDLFAVQDEITMKILTAIQVKLTGGEQFSRAEKYFKGKQGLDCYLKLMEAVKYLTAYNVDGTRLGRRIAEETLEMCPDNPALFTLMAWVNYLEYWMGLGKSPRESIEKGMEMVQKALAMDDSSPAAHARLSLFCTIRGEHERAIAEGERAVALMPGGVSMLSNYAMSLLYGGRPEEAIPVFQKAIRLSPFDSSNYHNLGHVYRVLGRFEEAVSEYKKALQRAPDNFFAHLGLAATYSMMGREQEARAEAAELLRLNPKFSVDSYAKRLTFKDQSVTDKFADALRKAGLK